MSKVTDHRLRSAGASKATPCGRLKGDVPPTTSVFVVGRGVVDGSAAGATGAGELLPPIRRLNSFLKNPGSSDAPAPTLPRSLSSSKRKLPRLPATFDARGAAPRE